MRGLFLLFVIPFLGFSQNYNDSIASVIVNDICSCVENIDDKEIHLIDQKGIECTNSCLTKHLDKRFLSSTNSEDLINRDIIMKQIGLHMKKCERITYLQKLTAVVPKPNYNISEKLFFKSDYIKSFGLDLNTVSSKSFIKIYDGRQEKDSIQRFADVRLAFDSNSDALFYMNRNLSELSENGIEIQLPVTKLGIDNFKIYQESELSRQKMRAMEVAARQYTLLFVKKNILVKLFFGVPTDFKLERLIKFVEKARDLIK